MQNNIRFKNFFVKPKMPDNLELLLVLARNIWTTWDADAYRLFQRIDPIIFRKYNHNPVKLLQKVSSERLEELSRKKGFLHELDEVYKKFKQYLSFVGHYNDEKENTIDFNKNFKVAYFSMEFGLQESLPIYSGGLGILSGDHLKSASDLGLPLIGFGLLYKYGYFLQKINLSGMQEEIYEENEWYSKAVQKVKDGENDMVFTIKIGGEDLHVQAWQVNVGKVPLYLLDTNLEVNSEKFRSITDYLYVDNKDLRLLQEIVLAYGSIELMKKLELNPQVYHLNEGHSAFLIIKRLNDLINKGTLSFHEAKTHVRATTVFTTHTPVPAGNEKFPKDLVKYYLEKEINSIGFDFEEFAKFAQIKDDDSFSMPALAIRFSAYINGVSELHSVVSKEMWHSIYPDLHENEMPIKAITNGVHIQTWLGKQLTKLFDRYIGPDYQHMAENETVWKNVFTIPDNEIWISHQQRKEQMISFIRKRLRESQIYQGQSSSDVINITDILNPNSIIIGFARRFAPYKRATLILKNKKRLLKLLNDSEKPIQFVFAGKAHPADIKGKELIKDIIDFARKNKVEDRFVFVENYDINIARHIVQGVDVWLNTPIKPLEASGTSGMKAGMNGVLNFSVLDGWWPECYNKSTGWSISAGENVQDEKLRDIMEANEIYDVIENEIAPLFYTRDKNNLPMDWISKMKASIYEVGKGFNTHRMLRNYIDTFYIPILKYSEIMIENNYENLKNLLRIENSIKNYWDKISVSEFNTNIYDNTVFSSGDKIEFDIKIYLDSLPQNLLQVELFYQYDDDEFEIIPFNFVARDENQVAEYRLIHLSKGAGKQAYNVRLRPKTSCFNGDYFELVKWVF